MVKTATAVGALLHRRAGDHLRAGQHGPHPHVRGEGGAGAAAGPRGDSQD